MGLASTLSSEEQAQLDIMIQLGFSTLQMSIRITRLRCCVRNYVRDTMAHGQGKELSSFSTVETARRLQKDNAAIHKSSSIMNWFSTKKIKVLALPADTPDLNLIENVWGLFAQAVYGHGKKFQTVAELKDAMKKTPVLIYLHGRYKIIETSALIYILGPVCETVIENIPEKNPFCDESDVELEGFMPEVHDETDLDENHVDDDENEDAQSQTSSSTIPEEEYDFERGLQFSAVNGSESSDDEFDLETSKKPVVRRRRQPKKPSAPVAAEEDYELLQF
uniref:HTH_Tnp_Tc3_1 domain-containing protein n=1 Tax=Caenorhabditis japonica TaxID=281687 RepID=A0A8R1IMA1_CAEJA